MPKRPNFKNNLTRLREGMDLSQPEFARLVGVSASIIKKLERGTRTLTPDLSARIFAETGIMLIPAPEETPIEYSKEQHEDWKKDVEFDAKSVEAAARVVMKLVRLMLAASIRPGVKKSYVVFNALIQAIEVVKKDFKMEKHIDAELRDRQSTQTKLYSVRELRQNDLLAKQVEFKDDPSLKDDQEIPLSKPVGWLPTKDFFNIGWEHQEFLNELASLKEDEELTEAQKAKLEQIKKQGDAEVDRFLPR
jgi:transcriptional regulator with XRE-family HTH domain